MGLAFERVCLEHISQIKKKLGISGVLTDVVSWYCKADEKLGIACSQIYLLIVRKDQVINLCEMKYSKAEYRLDENDYLKIQNRVQDLVRGTGTKKAVYPTLVTTYGIVPNSYSNDIQSVVTMDDLFTE